MKKNKFFYLPILFLLFSCGTTSSQQPTITPTNPPTSTSTEIPLVELETEAIIEGGSYGGYFIEINNYRLLKDNATYNCSFESNNSIKTFRVTSSRPESVTVELGANPLRDIIIKTHAPGDSIVQIYDADEMLVYRNVIRVRKGYSPEEIEEAIFDNDKYLGYKYLGDHRISFTETQPLVGVFSGSDDFESNMRIKFEATFVEYNELRDVYEFSLETIDRDQYSTTILTTLQVSITADIMYLYYSNEGVLLNMFVAEPYSELYGGLV